MKKPAPPSPRGRSNVQWNVQGVAGGTPQPLASLPLQHEDEPKTWSFKNPRASPPISHLFMSGSGQPVPLSPPPSPYSLHPPRVPPLDRRDNTLPRAAVTLGRLGGPRR